VATKDPSNRTQALAVETREMPDVADLREGETSHRGLTVLFHPDLDRIGEQSILRDLSQEVPLSRTGPEFQKPGLAGEPWPLGDPFLSRRPAFLREGEAGGLRITRTSDALQVIADGQAIEGERAFSRAELDKGVVLELGNRVVVLLHVIREPAGPFARSADLGLVGENILMHQLRKSVLRVADMPVPVLLRGETGTGKELVAQAIHASSSRASKPCLSVNMAAISASVAASELFGHAKGSFTGAVGDHAGYFARADGGTLFLDEIGETPIEVQVMLLRTLETKTIQPVGGRTEEAVDVRLIAATDADLELLVNGGKFRPALLHRLAGYEILLPALRDRRDDLGRLLVHFLRQELIAIGEGDRLEAGEPTATPWFPPAIAARLARYDWPGNVRQLRNVVRQLVISNRGVTVMQMDRAVERLLSEAPAKPSTPPPADSSAPQGAAGPPPVVRRKPSEVTEQELLEVLRQNRFRLEPTANQLRISRASLYMLIDKSARLRKAKDIPKDELLRVHAELNGDVDAMAEKIEVSSRGIYLRLKELLPS
jgi:two-component system nitrogen regulation response regulator GlnG